MDCFLEKIELDFENNAGSNEERKNKCSKCEDSFIFERSLKKHITSVHVEQIPEKGFSKENIKVKVIKAKKNCQKLARQPCKNLPLKPLDQRPELLVVGYVDGQAKATRDNPGEEEIKIEIEAVDSDDDFSAVRNPVMKIYGPLAMAKRPKLSLNEGDVLEKSN